MNLSFFGELALLFALLLQTIGLEFCLLGKCQKSVVELGVGAAAGWLAGWLVLQE
jgi:hypothetical protein